MTSSPPKHDKVLNNKLPTSFFTSESSDLSGEESTAIKKTRNLRTKKTAPIRDSNVIRTENENKLKSNASKLNNIDEFKITETENLIENQNKESTTIRFSIDKNNYQQQKQKKTLVHKNIEHSLSNCDVYIELEELHYNEKPIISSISNQMSSLTNHYEWKIKTRWIKYEQTIDETTHIWSKPFVGSLVYQNLILLKSKMQYASIILNSRENTFERIVDEVLLDLINRGQLEKDKKDMLKSILLSQHRNNLTLSGAMSGKTRREQTKARSFSFVTSNDAVEEEGGFNSNGDDGRRKSFSMNKLYNSYLHRNQSSAAINTSQNQNPNEAVKFFVASSNTLTNSAENVNGGKGTLNNSLISIAAQANSKMSPFYQFRHSLKAHHHHYGHHTKSDNSLNRVEAFVIMVGVLDFLDHFIDFGIRVRFLFIFLGPKRDNIDYFEIARCMGTLMTNKEFHDCAYLSHSRKEFLSGITRFSNKSLCLVFPVGDFDDDLLAPLIEWIKENMKTKLNKNNRKKLAKHPQIPVMRITESNEESDADTKHVNLHSNENHFDPFHRSRKPFGALFNEIKHRYKIYLSDFTDGLSVHCMIASIFIFTVCLAPALCFGGILAEKSDQWFGVNEMLLATSLNGIFFGLFSGQPLMIFGATGPFLVFEEMIYIFCKQYLCIEFMAARVWVALWILFYVLVILALEGVFVIHYVTRFSEEIFAFLIAIVFLSDAVKKIFYYFKLDPILEGSKYCDIYSNLSNSLGFKNKTSHLKSSLIIESINGTNEYNNITLGVKKYSRCFATSFHSKSEQDIFLFNDSISIYGELDLNVNHHYHYANSGRFQPEPNIALLSFMLVIGTCSMALLLKKLRRSNFFGSYIRRTLSDVGILISIVLAVGVDMVIKSKTHINTQKLDIPDKLVPTKNIRKNWFINPMGNDFDEASSSFGLPVWVPFAASLPAFIIFIVLFFEIELTGILLSSKHRKLKKGTGFNVDLLLGALMMTFNSFFGLPWMCAAPVRTLAHWASLTIYSSSYIPGEKPKLLKIKEQRVTSILVHASILLCLNAKFLLKLIPVPVLFGIFLYFGLVSLSGTQLYERIKLIFIPFKYCPNEPYAIGCRPVKRNIFTLIQILAVLVLLVFKSYARVSFLFPIFLLVLVPFRKFFLVKLFTNRELEQLDDDTEHQSDDIVHDFYELTHLPI